jgi:hypothetical protein
LGKRWTVQRHLQCLASLSLKEKTIVASKIVEPPTPTRQTSSLALVLELFAHRCVMISALFLALAGAVVLPDFIDVTNRTIVDAFVNRSSNASLALSLSIETSARGVQYPWISDLNQDKVPDVCVYESETRVDDGLQTRILCALSPHVQQVVVVANRTSGWRFASETPYFRILAPQLLFDGTRGSLQADLDGDGLLDAVFFCLFYQPGGSVTSGHRTQNMFVVFGNSSAARSNNNYFLLPLATRAAAKERWVRDSDAPVLAASRIHHL